jgi:nucleoid DNA-binding protein
MTTLTKEQISEYINKELGLSKTICEDLVSQVFTLATNLIAKDKHLTIKNFGTFTVKHKKSRPGVNLSTMTPLEIEERQVVTFTPSRSFKNKLNNI